MWNHQSFTICCFSGCSKSQISTSEEQVAVSWSMDLTDSHTLRAPQEYGLRKIEAKSRKKQPVVLRNSTVSFILSLPLFFGFLESIQSAKLPSLVNFVDDSRVRANWITTWCQNQTETAWRNISSFSSSHLLLILIPAIPCRKSI